MRQTGRAAAAMTSRAEPIVVLFLSILLLFVAAAPIYTHFDETLSGTQNVDMAEQRAQMRATGLERGLFHVKEIMTAISRGQRSLEVREHKDEVDTSLASPDDNYSAFFSQMLYTTVTKYNLLGENQVQTFMSLDQDHHARAINEIDSDSMKHCIGTVGEQQQQQHLQVGDIVIASEHGQDVHSDSSSTPSSLSAFMQSPSVQRNEGFKLIRRVSQVSSPSFADDNHQLCKAYKTEDLTPLEIFNDFSIDIDGKIPFRISTVGDDDKSRKLGDANAFPGQGLIACTDKMFDNPNGQSPLEFLGGGSFNLGYSAACLDYSYQFPGSIGVNYDFRGGGASVKSLAMADGVTCDECYAFIGPNLKVMVQYSIQKRFGFSARVSGAAGFAVNLGLRNPSVSGSTTIGLVAPQANYQAFKLPNGLGLDLKVGGLRATLSGTGSAVGTATLGAKASLNAAFGIVKKYGENGKPGVWSMYGLYSSGASFLPLSSYASSASKPSFSFSNFQMSTFGLRVDLRFFLRLLA